MFKLQTERWGKVEISFEHRNPIMGWSLSNAGTSCSIEAQIKHKTRAYRNTLSFGETHIHPLDIHSYCKERGRKLSLARALRRLGADKEERTQFWKAYFEAKENKSDATD